MTEYVRLLNHREKVFARKWPKKSAPNAPASGPYDPYSKDPYSKMDPYTYVTSYSSPYAYSDPYAHPYYLPDDEYSNPQYWMDIVKKELGFDSPSKAFYRAAAHHRNTTPKWAAWRPEEEIGAFWEADLFFDQLLRVKDEAEFLSLFEHALKSKVFLYNPRDFIERFVVQLQLYGARGHLAKAIPLLFQKIQELSDPKLLEKRKEALPGSPLDRITFFEKELGLQPEKSTLDSKLRIQRLEIWLKKRHEAGDTQARVEKINTAIEERLKNAQYRLLSGQGPFTPADTEGEALLHKTQLIDLFTHATPKDRESIITAAAKHPQPLFGTLTHLIDQHEDYVAPFMEPLVEPTLSKALADFQINRPHAQDKRAYDQFYAPLVEASLDLQIKQEKHKPDIFTTLDVAHTMVMDHSQNSKLDESPTQIAKMEIKGLTKVFGDQVKENDGKFYPLYTQNEKGQLIPFHLVERLEAVMKEVNHWLPSVVDQGVVDSTVRDIVTDVANAIRGLKDTLENATLAKDLAAACQPLLARASDKTRRGIVLFLFHDLYRTGTEDIINVLYEELITLTLRNIKPTDAKFAVGSFWKDTKRMANEKIFRFVVRTSLDPGIYPKLTNKTPEGASNSELQLGILHTLAEILRTTDGKKVLAPLESQYQDRKASKGSVQSLYQFMDDHVYPLVSDRDLALMALNQSRETLLKNPFAK